PRPRLRRRLVQSRRRARRAGPHRRRHRRARAGDRGRSGLCRRHVQSCAVPAEARTLCRGDGLVASIPGARRGLAMVGAGEARAEAVRDPGRRFVLSPMVARKTPNRRGKTSARKPAATPARRKPLAAYAEKRDFARTPEPKPKHKDAGSREFVVQKHSARRLHYDLRLELDDVLVSWAVTRGPSL